MTTADQMLLGFPYYENYVDLIRMELASVEAAGGRLCRFAIIGSGPLPLTALCIAEYVRKKGGRSTCLNIDESPKAIALSKDTCRALGHTEKTMSFQCCSADDAAIDLRGFDVIYLAALVGTCSKTKMDILENLAKRLRRGAIVVLRSSRE